MSNNPTSPQVITRNYTYLQDNGTYSSGVLTNTPYYPGIPFVEVDSPHTYNYLMYSASTNSAGVGGTPDKFFYSKVTETISSNGETHKSDHYFTIFPELYEDVRQTEQIDYTNLINTNIFTPVTKTITNYTSSSDTTFTGAAVYIDTEYVNSSHSPSIWYSYQAGSQTGNESWWVRPTTQVTTQYDINNDSIITTLTYNFNSTTRNLTSITQNTSDGQTIKQKFKYPEDYSSAITGKLVSVRVLSPVVEKQTWLYPNSSDSLLISGAITQYDTTIFKPIAGYTIELTKSIPVLNNETVSSGHYTTLLSDSRYVIKEQLQYDGNANLEIATKSPDMNTWYIWDYRHCLPIATVTNAADSGNAYTSFEADGGGGWAITGNRFYTTSAVTGNQSYSLSSGGISTINTTTRLNSSMTYIVSYWSDSGSYSVYGSTGILQGKTITINGVAWTYYEHTVYGTPWTGVTGTGHIDEVRLYIKGALMTTTTYSPLIGITSSCDADNRVTYYIYDAFNRVKVVKDQDQNIIKTYQYHTLGETAE